MDQTIMNRYLEWVNSPFLSEKEKEELASIKGDEKEIIERFYRDLEFGTGGLRGVMALGTNRMNRFIIAKATQGLANYLLSKYEKPSVAIGHDSRNNSDSFSKVAAGVLAANGVKVYIYPELMPTPALSFAVRHLNCSAGIVVTASHNPKQYNGYKVYGDDGCQCTIEAADAIYAQIQKIDVFKDVKYGDFDTLVKSNDIVIIGNDVFFHNGLELDSDYKNKDQYPDEIDDYKLTRAKVNNSTKDVYDVKDGALKNTYTKLENYDSIDDYYMLPDTSWTANDTKIIRKTTKSGKDTYKLGLTTNGIKTILEKYNKSIRLDQDGTFDLDVYKIASDFQPRKANVEYVVSNNLIETIEMEIKGFYVLSTGKQVKFEFNLDIEFDHNHKAYTAPTEYNKIDLPNF